MYSAWFGTTNSGLASNVNGTANFHPITGAHSGGWSTSNTTRCQPVSEAVTIVGLYVFVTPTPSPGNWVFAIDVGGTASGATCTVAAGATSATFTGSVAVAQDALISLRCTPNASAAVGTLFNWIVEYQTAGDFFCMMGGANTAYATAANNFWDPTGHHGTTVGTTAPVRSILCPAAGTLTRLSVATPVGVVGGTSYAVSLRTNDTTDNLTATMTAAQAAAQATGSVAVAAGDSMTIKGVPTGTPTARQLSYCLTIAPTQRGETWNGAGTDNNASPFPADTTSRYEVPQGQGFPDANGGVLVGAETSRSHMLRAGYVLRNLYWKTATAPGGVTTRTLTIREAAASTVLTATITGAATTANDTTHRAVMLGATSQFDLEYAATGPPVASAWVQIGYVIEIPQPYAPPPSWPLNSFLPNLVR